jgi:hypothetical protein
MKFSARRDADASAEDVYAYITDYAAHESLAARRGIRIERINRPRAPADYPAWKAEFQYGGRERDVVIEVNTITPDEYIGSDVVYQSLGVHVDLELVPLARTRTRMIVKIELKPQSIKARLIVQSLRLAKGTIQKRLEKRLDALAADIVTKNRS